MGLSETQHGIRLAKWLRARGICFTHVPNEGLRSKIGGRNLKLQGMSPGFSDYVIFDRPPKRKRAHGVIIELKKLDATPSDFKARQRYWIAEMAERGWVAFCSPGHIPAIEALEDLGYGSFRGKFLNLEPD